LSVCDAPPVDLLELTAQVTDVSRRYAERFGIARTSDWHILKLHEEVGELTQAHLMREGQARSKGMTHPERDAKFAAEIADVLCHVLLVASHHSIDLQAEVERKWLTRVPRNAVVNAEDVPAASLVDGSGISRGKRPPRADERTTTLAFLRWHRETLRLKCADLEPAQLARQPVGRSALSLLGLVRHAAESERFWFREVMAGEDGPPLYPSPDLAFDVAGANAQTVAQAFEAWRAEVEFAERFVETAPDLDVTGNEPGEGPVSLRWVLTHMLEEYARHNGHADLLREQIDGTVGL
jgi:NTP pyrophosphatase (non-canonical NTP hydrolase)/uncharacterized damage-inducible protein DinB